MDKKINNFFILGIILIVFCIQFVTSDATLCYQQNPSSGGTKITCNGIGCLWVSNSSAEFALSQTDLYDPYCNWGGHCCMPNECWRFDGNSAGCTNSSDTLNCTYDPFQWKTLGNGTTMYGVCFTDYSTSNTGGAAWSGMTIGCWQYCADYATCTNALNSQKCSWKPNDLNQNPSCHIKTLSEARATRNGAATLDIGCCETKSCMSFDGNESLCVNNTAFKGLCNWKSKVSDPYCPNSVGCCVGKWCSEILDPINCSKMKTDLFMPCNWTGVSTYALGGRCNESVGGAFSFYNDTDSCMSAGGWYNSSGSCITPTTGASGAGGFMFAGTPKCWFADNQKDTCKNVTGCVYCYDATTQLNNYSSACYNRMNGSCQGHENVFQNWNGSNYVTIQDIQSDALSCGNLTLKSACEYGPLPNCVWSNSSTNDGDFCQVGTSTTQRNAPPVSYCDHPLAQNNYTLCLELSQSYLMPCKWGNVSSNRTSADNCTFNQQAVFGAGAATSDIDYTIVSSEMSCIAAGGTWKSEYYLDSDGTFKRDSWCEKGALFNFVTGQAFGNKGNCDSDCWACEFNSTGGAWASTAIAEAACLNSKKGTCQWRTDANAPNKKGWCEYPNDFSFGGTKDCNTDCKGCEYVGNNLANASKACYGSYAGCIWINDSTAINGKEGYCISSSKKSCLTDCNNCYDQSSCSNISSHPSLNCSWDVNIRFCKPYGFTGEVCFNGGDDDNDNTIDCGDTDCTYDQFCGGASVGSGTVDCKKVNMTSCNTTVTSSGKNCTSIPSMYGMEGYCDFPGSNCWIFDDNSASCNRDRGCIYRNSTGGYLNSSLRNADKAFTGYCTINQTKSSQCMNASNSVNATLCALTNTCEWITDTYNLAGGRCDLKVFVKCGNQSITSSLSCYAAGGGNMCTWTNHSGTSTGGWCEPQCKDKTIEDCNSNTYCAAKASMCEPEMFGGMSSISYGGGGIGGGGTGCHMYDGNSTACNIQNASCSWAVFSQNSSQGVCEPKGQNMMMQGMDQSPPKILGSDVSELNIVGEVDIMQYGVKEAPTSLAFGVMVRNITNASVCRGYHISPGVGAASKIGTGNATTKFYWFLDTNKITTDGCNATNQTLSNITGFEFMMKYVVSLTNGTPIETKSFYRCSSGSWGLTNVPLTSNRQLLCGMSMPSILGGVMIMAEKESLESFSEYNKTAPIRVFVSSSSNDSYSENNPIDSVGTTGYYTTGTADFKFVDCSNPTNKNDNKCMNFNKFGFNIFEDCKNGIDDDSDSLTDCADVKCKYTPVCSGTAFNFVVDANDVETPTVSFSQVDTLPDGAFVKFDSSEPANGTLLFYYNDSSCSTLNASINDLGDPSLAFDDYKPFHIAGLDFENLRNSLVNGTIYYYKTMLCDPSGNCAMSACQNLTTKTDNATKSFIFKMKLPAGYNVTIPQLSYSGNFSTVMSGKVYETGLKTNASAAKRLNITVNCGTQSLTFVGADILKPKSIDMSTAFICDTTNKVLGMNSSSKAWNQLIGDIGMGGKSDYVDLEFPIAYAAANTIRWCDDILDNCTTVNTYASCSSGGTGITDCKIPTSLGFSAYQITTPVATTSDSSSGGGGSISNTYTVSATDFEKGYTKQLLKNEQLKMTIAGAEHKVKLVSIGTSSVVINVSSTSQQATLNVGESKNFDVTEDKVYDLTVTLNSINSTGKKADITVKKYIAGASITGEVVGEEIKTEEATTAEEEAKRSKFNAKIGAIVGVILVVLIGAGIALRKKYSK